jgi:KaiC/GvpD/RAD55 family RecA-like ATPase
MKKLSTGIGGLDKILGGGIPEEYVMLVSGTCGAGKSILGMQFLVSGDEPGVYVSFEEELDDIRENAALFGWDLEKLEKRNRIRLLKYDPFRLEDILEVIENNIREIGAKRVVFDSAAALGIHLKEPSELRRMILQIKSIMKKNRCTTIIISETLPGSSVLSVRLRRRRAHAEFCGEGRVQESHKRMEAPRSRPLKNGPSLRDYGQRNLRKHDKIRSRLCIKI